LGNLPHLWQIYLRLFSARKYFTGLMDRRLEALLQVDGGGVIPADIGIALGVLASDTQVIEDAIQKLLAQDVDMFVLMGDLPVLRTRQVAAGTGPSVVFLAVTDPVGSGVMENISHPTETQPLFELARNSPKH
jgi:hypothetical protein